MRHAAVGRQFIDIGAAIDEIEAIDIVDKRRCQRRAIRATGYGLKICNLQVGSGAKETALDIKHQTIKDGERVAAANDCLLLDFEQQPGDGGGIRDVLRIKGENTAILFVGCIITHHNSANILKRAAKAAGFR